MLQQEFVRYGKPIDILIGLKSDQVSIHPLGNDAFIVVNIGGHRYDALVPTWALGENGLTVVAARVAHTDTHELVYFPVSNEGRPTWVIPKTDLDSIVLETAVPE